MTLKNLLALLYNHINLILMIQGLPISCKDHIPQKAVLRFLGYDISFLLHITGVAFTSYPRIQKCVLNMY